MPSKIAHHYIKHPETPWYSLSYKKAVETLCKEKGVLHVYSEKDDFRIRQQLCLGKRSCLKKRIEKYHWIYCLKEDISSCKYLTEAEQYGASRISLQKALETLIKDGSLKLDSTKVPSLSKAYYSSDFFQETAKSINVDPSTEKGVSVVTIAS